ncbi:MAG TPA: GntR family transcriptional regulator [Pseudonocardiaceae bacterium]|jgi:DNA-binding GntR family transcriptional regulator|nr:GntR family transcriptional regulator [Pseudonocardiaceae bacterium]
MGAASELAATQLRQAIRGGQFVPGEHLGEVELATRLGVSRTPIREALRLLEAQGLVEILPNKGARVIRWSIEDLEEIYDLRSMLESHAAFRAATRVRPPVVRRLFGLCADMEDAARGGPDDLVRLSELNNQFHGEIIRAADSPRLTTSLASVVQVSLVARTFAKYSPEELARSMNHHRELASAMEAGAPEWASAVMKSHVVAARNASLAAESCRSPAMREKAS